MRVCCNPRMPSAPSAAASLAAPVDGAPVETGPSFSPLYRQIKTLITAGLQAGEWTPGQAIPSETELAARFKVSQGTVRKAIDELAGENLLVRRQGKGTFVATHAEEKTQFRFLRLTAQDGSSGALRRTSSIAGVRARRPRSRGCSACARTTTRCRCAACCTSPSARSFSTISGCRRPSSKV